MSHWYTADGKSMHEVPNASKPGEMRATTLKDARKLKLYPSVTTVMKVRNKGDTLEDWKIRQALYSAAIHPDGWPQFPPGVLDEKDPAFVKWAKDCMMDARKQVQAKAERGSLLHDMMLRAHKNYDLIPPQFLAHVDGMFELLERTFGKGRKWVAERSFCNTEWGFGGSVDLRTEPDDPDPIVLDYKFKDFDESRDAKYFVYTEHACQMAGYRLGVGMPPNTRLFNAFGSATHPGLVLLHEHSAKDADVGEEIFKAVLRLWQAESKYTPPSLIGDSNG